MSDSTLTRSRVVVLAILAGVSFSLIGVMYDLGKKRQPAVAVPQVMIVQTGVGLAVFVVCLLRRGNVRTVMLGAGSRRVWAGSAIAGTGQVGLLLLLELSFQHKLPLTPIWCANSLNFVPVILYSWVVFREPLNRLRQLAVLTAVGCVVISSMSAQPGDGGAAAVTGPDGGNLWLLLTILTGVVVCNSANPMAMKDLSMKPAAGPVGLEGQSLMRRHRDLYMVLLYAMVALGAVAYCLVAGLPLLTPTTLVLGLGAAAGSVTGMALLAAVAEAEAAVVFTLNGIAGVMAAAIVSVLALGEPFSGKWIATMTLATAAIVLGSGMGRRKVREPSG